jgi:hypothetical protein
MVEGSWVGLDVHARKIVAGVLEGESGELRSLRAPTLPAETVEWWRQFPAPVRVAYEAGPTGYGLARACSDVGDRVYGRGAVEDPACFGRQGQDRSS